MRGISQPQLRPRPELLPYRRCAPAAEMFTFPTESGEKNAKWGFSPLSPLFYLPTEWGRKECEIGLLPFFSSPFSSSKRLAITV